MPSQPIAIKSVGLVTSVGLSAPASCAAFRAKISNPTETRFRGSDGGWIMAHQVLLEQPWRGLTKLAMMAAMAISEALEGIPKEEWSELPLLLCVAEAERPGRLAGLDGEILLQIQKELGVTFAPQSKIVAEGRIGVAVALHEARKLMAESNISRALVAATDSLLSWLTLSHYDNGGRLLSASNSNGFLPGEGAGALLVAMTTAVGEMRCTGIGFGTEAAHINSDLPLRADGLTLAIKQALLDAGCEMHDLNYRITDISGEQYWFKEASLALSRTLRKCKGEFDLWHPAECIGEAGPLAALSGLSLAESASRKAYARGRSVLLHMAADSGRRAAITLQWGG